MAENTLNFYKREPDGTILDVGPALPSNAPFGHDVEN